MKNYVIIVAGGSGSRMKSDTPKQFLQLAELPVLMHTIQAFYAAMPSLDIVLVLPASEMSTWHSLVRAHTFSIRHRLVSGGSTRFESVKNGLDSIVNDTDDAIVAIHDGVRPLVSGNIIKDSFDKANLHGAAVTAVALKDSIRKGDMLQNKAENRADFFLVQTPQTFRLQLITNAYHLASEQPHINFTDDASVAEAAGHLIQLIPGDYKNIKITTPEDLIIAEALYPSLGE